MSLILRLIYIAQDHSKNTLFQLMGEFVQSVLYQNRSIAVVTIMFRNLETALSKGVPCHVARRLASLEPPMPFRAWREELQEMAAGLPARLT
jgi:hypothetical protein